MTLRERGSVLVLALLVSASAAIAGMWMVLTSDLRSRANRYLARAGDATRNALTGLEAARSALGQDSSWAGQTTGVGDPSAGEVTVTATPIGVYRSSVRSVGKIQETLQTVTAELRAPADPTLDFNVISGSTITFKDTYLGGHLRANGNVVASGDVTFSGTLETTDGSTVTSSIPTSQVAYVSTSIAPPSVSISALAARCSPLIGVAYSTTDAALLIDKVRFAPNSNPYGGINALGAYSLDAATQNVVIRNSYVSGMLVVKNAGSVRIESSYYQERADASLPSIVVAGDLDLAYSDLLDETVQLVDYNGDGDMLDAFASQIDGIAYATGKLTLECNGIVKGAAMGASVTINATPKLSDQPQLDTTPVREFILSGAFEVVPGTIGGSQ